MKKFFLLFFVCFGFFIPGCSSVPDEEDPEDRGGFEDDGGDEEGERRSRRSQGSKSEIPCKGDGYTLYLDDCQEGEEGEYSSRSSTLSSEGLDGYETERRPVDILFVLNTSNTMYWYIHHGFKKKFSNFISHLDGLDWRMLFTNASYYKKDCFLFGCGGHGPKRGEAMPIDIYPQYHWPPKDKKKRYLDTNFPSQTAFMHTITASPDRSYQGEHVNDRHVNQYPPHYGGGEYPLRALQAGFSANKSLTREEADFVAIIVSHEDEQPRYQLPPVTAKSLKGEFQKVYGEGKRLYVMSIIILPGDKECLLKNQKREWFVRESSEGRQLATVAKETGGGRFSICLEDYYQVALAIKRISAR